MKHTALTQLNTMINCPVFEASISHPNKIAIDDGLIKLTYLELHELANGIEDQIINLKGKTVNLICYQKISSYIMIIALYRLGISFILLNPKLSHNNNYVIDPSCYQFIRKSNGSTTINHIKPAFFFSSSGTTGNPKIIAHSLSTIFHSAIGSIHHYQLNENDSYLANLPLHHVSGFLIFFRMILSKGTILINKDKHFTFCSMVPTQLYRILKEKTDLHIYKNCRYILLGGSPISKKILDLASKANLNISCTYGMSEMGSQITAGFFSLGHPILFREIKIANDNEILCKGDNLFLGYGIEPKMPILNNGFFPTKDLGTYDKINGLTFIGRKDRLIVKGGENIQPEKIESIIMELGEINFAICIGLENEEYGQVLGCYIDPYNEKTKSLINFHLKEKLNSFFQISEFYPLSLNDNFKVNFNQLKNSSKRIA